MGDTLDEASHASLSPKYLTLLSSVCDHVVRMHQPNTFQLQARNTFVEELENFIHDLYQDSRLSLFGSSVNGFALCNSDLDISLAFDNLNRIENKVELIQDLAMKLETMDGIVKDSVEAIIGARVPIVKLKSVQLKSKLNTGHPNNVDISLYNLLAIENSRMLASYAAIDDRVKTLGCLVKIFYKTLDNSSHLSSYAYILMVIFYLQQ